MADRAQRADVLIVGAGVIGMSIAWRAARRGMSVTVLERGVAGGGTSRVAAGMLAPVAEAEFGGAAARRLLELNLRSARLWPAFAAELEDDAEASVGLVRSGALLVAGDADEAAELERQRELRESLGLAVQRLRPSEAREREPALAPTLRLALEAPEDHSVDPRLVLAALREACARAGVELREHAGVAALVFDDGRGSVSGVTLADGDRLECERVVLAAGPWTGSIGVPESAAVPVRPVKGQIMRLRDPAGPGLLTRVLRFSGGYVVPRGDGRYVLGATVEERGFELAPTAGGVYELLRDAHEIVPGVSEWRIEELEAGLRPGTPDNAPALGPAAVEGLWWATGHYRNGILLAPLSAELLASSLAGEPGSWLDRETADELLRACDPARFGAGAGAPKGTRSLEAVR
jgi:glycine oxidase